MSDDLNKLKSLLLTLGMTHPHYAGLMTSAVDALTKLTAERDAAWEAGRDAAEKVAETKRDEMAAAGKRAADAGRDIVASHRESDVETASDIVLRIRALKKTGVI